MKGVYGNCKPFTKMTVKEIIVNLTKDLSKKHDFHSILKILSKGPLYVSKTIDCVVPENTHTPPHGWLMAIPRGWGGAKG